MLGSFGGAWGPIRQIRQLLTEMLAGTGSSLIMVSTDIVERLDRSIAVSVQRAQSIRTNEGLHRLESCPQIVDVGEQSIERKLLVVHACCLANCARLAAGPGTAALKLLCPAGQARYRMTIECSGFLRGRRPIRLRYSLFACCRHRSISVHKTSDPATPHAGTGCGNCDRWASFPTPIQCRHSPHSPIALSQSRLARHHV